MRFRVLPYRQGSRSAGALATALGGRVLRLEGSTFVKRRDDIIINWGSTARNDNTPARTVDFNIPHAVHDASNKLNFFRAMPEGLTPRYWTRQEDIPQDAYPIVCRTVLAGHSGAGIVVANTPADLVPAPLYVQYVKKESEYRIHVGKSGEDTIVISEQRKARRQDAEVVNWQIRNHQNGFIYARENIEVPESVREVARQAMRELEIDFGAVDVIYNRRQNRAYVLEVNTAPGLEGRTVIDYADYFRRLVRNG
jgi:glutathione synthase/RimK-type ligase-like ATP-grasp enzyme